MDWQPIDTAPHDQDILVWCEKSAGEISGVNYLRKFMSVTQGGPTTSDYPGDNWWMGDGDCYATWVWPTHWMPLPEPPKT